MTNIILRWECGVWSVECEPAPGRIRRVGAVAVLALQHRRGLLAARGGRLFDVCGVHQPCLGLVVERAHQLRPFVNVIIGPLIPPRPARLRACLRVRRRRFAGLPA